MNNLVEIKNNIDKIKNILKEHSQRIDSQDEKIATMAKMKNKKATNDSDWLQITLYTLGSILLVLLLFSFLLNIKW